MKVRIKRAGYRLLLKQSIFKSNNINNWTGIEQRGGVWKRDDSIL